MHGRIHSIDTFSTVDGPGIRTVVFMQGCSLRCQYCQNPDTWDHSSSKAKEYSDQDISALILHNADYFEASGGGVTFSGGEPLLQHSFVRQVCALCREKHIHTAIDTSLYVPSEYVLNVLPYIDLVLADIKHINNVKSISLTGQSNRLNLKNLELINQTKVEIWIRYVVVPGITDTNEDLLAMAEFIRKMDSVSRIDLLPYHTLGRHKWALLHLTYPLAEIPLPNSDELERIKHLLENNSGKPVFILH